MHPIRHKRWRCGPLEVWERYFEDTRVGAPPLTIQWAVVLEGSLVVLTEQDGKRLSSVMDFMGESCV